MYVWSVKMMKCVNEFTVGMFSSEEKAMKQVRELVHGRVSETCHPDERTTMVKTQSEMDVCDWEIYSITREMVH